VNGTLHVDLLLPGWDLFWSGLELVDSQEDDPAPAAVAALKQHVENEARQRFSLERIAESPTVAAMRALFRRAGCDPTRYRPSSEALLRRVLKGDSLPAIHPLVDLNNCLSVQLAIPCCVLAEGSVEGVYCLTWNMTAPPPC
jgi:DNA/RNA-binding domain of Phe-tRNA-synthetase-like protein